MLIIKLINKQPGDWFPRLCFLIALLILYTSCTEEYDFPDHVNNMHIVVNALNATSDTLVVFMNSSSYILDNNIKDIKNAEIEFYQDDIQIGFLNHHTKNKYFLAHHLKPEYRYKMKAYIPDYDKTVISCDTMPQKVHILDAEYTQHVYTDQYGTKFGKVNIAFKDNPDKNNYYELFFIKEDKYIFTFKVNSTIINVDTEDDIHPPKTLLFSDELINGDYVELEIFLECSYKTPNVVLRNVSYSYYMYKSSLYEHLATQHINYNNLFDVFKGQVSNLYTNIENGLGIFALYTEDKMECKRIQK